MEFIVQKVTESTKGGYVVTIAHESFVELNGLKQKRSKRYCLKDYSDNPVAVDDVMDIDLRDYDIVLLENEGVDDRTGEITTFRTNWLFPR